MHQDSDLFQDPKIRKAMRLAINISEALKIVYLGLGLPAEHCPGHRGGKGLLAAAGKPDGFDCKIYCKKDPDWESIAVELEKLVSRSRIGARVRYSEHNRG
jgi:peptide/nickel transport system substrate-binding protein